MFKVLMIESSLGIGGQEKISIELSQFNNQEICTDFLVAGDDTGPFREYLEQNHFQIISVDSPRDGYIRYFNNLRNCIRTYGPYDILYSNGVLNNGLNVFYGWLLGIPRRISHSHNSTSGRQGGVVSFLYERFMKCLIRLFSTDYLSCGELAGIYLYGKRFYKKHGVEIPNGIEVDSYLFDKDVRERYRDQLRLNPSTRVYGIVARLSEQKNHVRLLHIFRSILSVHDDRVLLIIGDGERRQDIEDTISALSIQEKVLLLGNRSDIPELLFAMDFFVLPSAYEGVPVSLVEAQAAGLKCIVSDSVSKEVDVTGSVCFFSLSDSDEALAEVFENQQSIARIKANAIVKNSRFNIEKSRELLLRIYQS